MSYKCQGKSSSYINGLIFGWRVTIVSYDERC